MKIGIDKKYHWGVCLLISFLVSSICANLFHPYWWVAVLAGFLTAVAIGVWKEVKDSKQPGNHFCWHDLIADACGALSGCLAGLFSLLI